MNATTAGINFGSAWEVVADHASDRLALASGEVNRTWGEFEDRASRIAGALAAAGVGPGDNVACALYNGNEYLEAEFAAFKLRAAPCNVNYRYVERELEYLVDNSDSKAVFFDSALTERFDSIQAGLTKVRQWIHVGAGECPSWADRYESLVASSSSAPRIDRSGDDLWILYTGGTTGNPKGVMWPQANLVQLAGRQFAALGLELPENLAQIPAALDAIDALGATPVQLAASPLMHGTAGIGALFNLFMGGAVATLTSRSFDAAELWRVVEGVRCTTISIVGDVFSLPMVEVLDSAEQSGKPIDLSSVSRVSSSGVMWSQPVKDRLLAHAQAQGSALACHDSLGASEGVGFGAKLSGGDDDTTTATFTLGPNAALFSADGVRIQPGSDEAGLLAVTGPIPLGYYGDPVKTAETFRTYEGQRWSIPGDWARVDSDGIVTLMGRGSVSINTAGEKVFPEEVEEALKLLPEVIDASVVGLPDPKWGSAVTAVVEFSPEAAISDEDVISALRSLLSGYKLPKKIVRVESLYRSPNGKSDYKWATKVAAEA